MSSSIWTNRGPSASKANSTFGDPSWVGKTSQIVRPAANSDVVLTSTRMSRVVSTAGSMTAQTARASCTGADRDKRKAIATRALVADRT